MDRKLLPPADVMASVDVQELNRLFVNSGRLDSEAIVQFVKTLSAIAAEELRPVGVGGDVGGRRFWTCRGSCGSEG